MYNIVVFGEERVGKTRFMDVLDKLFARPTEDFSPSLFIKSLSQADGVVLLYDITSMESFEHVTTQAYMYACTCSQYMTPSPRPLVCEYILVGNQRDVVDADPGARRVDAQLAEQWAQSQGMKYVEVTSASHEEVEAAIGELLRSIQYTANRAEEKAQEQRNKTSMRNKMKLAFGRTKSDA